MELHPSQEKALSLFKYLFQLCSQKQAKSIVTDIEKEPIGQESMHIYAQDIPEESAYVTTGSSNSNSDVPILFSIRKPGSKACPEPDAKLAEWLIPGWEDYHKEAKHLSYVERTVSEPATETSSVEQTSLLDVQEEEAPTENEQLEMTLDIFPERAKVIREVFDEDEERVAAWEAWIEQRTVWCSEEKRKERVKDCFSVFYDMYNLLRRDPDNYELLVGNGLLTDRKDARFSHPILLKKASISLNPSSNVLFISDEETDSELYSLMLNQMEGIQTGVLPKYEERLHEQDVHPFDEAAGSAYLKELAASLGPNCCFLFDASESAQSSDRYVVSWKPVFFVRKRIDGTLATMRRIIEAIDQGTRIPGTITGIVGGNSLPQGGTISEKSEKLTSTGEQTEADEDILLPKPANREQLDIAREISKHSAVLVQGPPGTGKTHTIANLMGHFLAQGKSVLVTSQTSKALRVLKDKVPDAIKSLCVTVLEDSNRDMERSVEDIVEYMSTHSPQAALRHADELKDTRDDLLKKLSLAKERAYRIRNREFQPIVYMGESWSPARAAAYIAAHAEQLDVIPGNIPFDAVFPLSEEELVALYASNAKLSVQEEAELDRKLPSPDALMTPQVLRIALEQNKTTEIVLRRQGEALGKELVFNPVSGSVTDILTGEDFVHTPNLTLVPKLEQQMLPYQEHCTDCMWIAQLIADSSENGSRIQLWKNLAAAIDDTYSYAETLVSRLFCKSIEIGSGLSLSELMSSCQELYAAAQKKNRLPKQTLLMPKAQKMALAQVQINHNTPQTLEDMRLILDDLELLHRREILAAQWNALMAANGERCFDELGSEPERYCHAKLPELQFFLSWLRDARPQMVALFEEAGLQGATEIFRLKAACLTRESAQEELRRFCARTQATLRIVQLLAKNAEFQSSFESTQNTLSACRHSAICAHLLNALTTYDVDQYELYFHMLTDILSKSTLYEKRRNQLQAIGSVSTDWKKAIADRLPPHDSAAVPEGLIECFKLKQLDAMVRDIAQTSLSDVEKEIWRLNKRLQHVTADLASELAWYHTLRRVQSNPETQQALNGWKMTIRKIGKGTRKQAPKWRREAQRLMGKCQRAVPAWIMPVSKVMDTVNPMTTRFDIVIIDEASQCDPTAIALLFMAKKAIVVGDDKQVSPMAVGMESDAVNSLINTYIQGVIPNAHLFGLDDSLYNIVSMSYKPLLLREHFRCVPDIIGYSNHLSYDNKIIPLREAGSTSVQPGMISYRVQGARNGKAKTNFCEAETIVAMMMACMEQSEYEGKTFGAISLLGQDQVKLIDRLLFEHVDIAVREQRQILCGDASNFQGDERDVIFLSIVDSNQDGDGPLRMMAEGSQDSNKQRYNVAVSRARDQLWVVHSLDSSCDLKTGDIRKDLLEYAEDPHAYGRLLQSIEHESESPFEKEVAIYLALRGYHLKQQYAVGAYRIDMIAIYQTNKVAIECDGEQYHGGEEKIRADMERQSILERLGWRFIRIRGSEYYRDKEASMQRVVRELTELGIQPEQSDDAVPHVYSEHQLVDRVKLRATQLLDEWHGHTVSSAPVMEEIPVTEERISDSRPGQEALNLPAPENVSVQRRRRRQGNGSASAQQPMNEAQKLPRVAEKDTSPMERFIAEAREGRFSCIDHRETAAIFWVIYAEDRQDEFEALAQKHSIPYTLERRGARATQNRPAWRIMCR